MSWFMTPSHKSAPEFKTWNRARRAWKTLCKHVHWIKSVLYEEAIIARLWFNPDSGNLIFSAFSRERATGLHKLGLRIIKDAWHFDQQRCLIWNEASTRYHFLRNKDEAGWEIIERVIPHVYGTILSCRPLPPTPYNWLGLYIPGQDHLPVLVIKGPGNCNINCKQRSSISILKLPNLVYSVNLTSRTFSRIPDLSLWIQANPNLWTALEQDLDYKDWLICVVKKV